MKKLITVLSMFTAVIIVLTASVSATKSQSPVSESQSQTVAQSVSPAINARLLNMLNHNYIYDDDFSSDKIIIENSILALLDKADNGEIDKDVVLGFISNMYGRTVDESAVEYDFLPASEGKFAILARGYDVPTHTITKVDANEGGYTVYSDMTVESHDNGEYCVKVKTVFATNNSSAFGYNIISSDIISGSESSNNA